MDTAATSNFTDLDNITLPVLDRLRSEIGDIPADYLDARTYSYCPVASQLQAPMAFT